MNFPPVIEGGNFIFGQFGRNLKDPINFIQENQKKYGNVFIMQGIFELFRTNYVLSEEGINMVLKAPEEKFNFRNGIRKFIRAVFGEYKEVPREEELDWNKRVIQGIKRSQKINQESINFSLKEILPKYSEKGQFEFDEMIEELVYKINICSMLGRDALKDFEEIKTCLSGVEHYGFQPLSMLFPYAPFGTSKKTRELKKRAIEIFGGYIQKRRQSNESIDDYLSIWAQSPHVAGEDKGKDYTDEEITNRIINITIAAHVNTAVTLEHVLIKIFQNKEYLQRVREEVRELENQEKDVTSSVLVSNAIKEVMRISNAGSFMRRIEEDTMFEGYLLEKGTMIATSAAHIHFSPEIFPDPYSFKPDRWEDSNLNKYAYWFGMGTHRCKGDQYALQILKSVVVDIAKKWELEFHNKNTEDFEVDWTKNRKPKGKIIASLKSSKN